MIAGEQVRDAAGWHIAPERTEQVYVTSDGGHELFLPTLHLVEVTEVRKIDDDGTVDDDALTGYRLQPTPEFRAGLLSRCSSWPVGVLRVSLTHGFEGCPVALLGTVAETIRLAGVKNELASRSIGDRSESWRDGLSGRSRSALDRYTIPRRP